MSSFEPIWWFLEIGAPPNHPFYIIGFSITNQPFWGTPIYGTPIYGNPFFVEEMYRFFHRLHPHERPGMRGAPCGASQAARRHRDVVFLPGIPKQGLFQLFLQRNRWARHGLAWSILGQTSLVTFCQFVLVTLVYTRSTRA